MKPERIVVFKTAGGSTWHIADEFGIAQPERTARSIAQHSSKGEAITAAHTRAKNSGADVKIITDDQGNPIGH